MYVLRNKEYDFYLYDNSKGLVTSNKHTAKVFNTVQEAEDYYYSWLDKTVVDKANVLKLAIVEVETKLVITKHIREIKLL